MKDTNLLEALTAFTNTDPDQSLNDAARFHVSTLSGGLINHSFLVEIHNQPPLLLQQINQEVFTRPEDVQYNYLSVYQYALSGKSRLRLPRPVYRISGESLFTDMAGNCWRAFEYIAGSFTPSVAEKPQQARATANTFAKFTSALADFNLQKLKIVIPDFHNLSYRYFQFDASVKQAAAVRMEKAFPLVTELKQREPYRHFYDTITGMPEDFPQRVMHHDAKIANVLFHKKTGRVICPVDFDTVMPGFFFSDLGDMIRSMAGSGNENDLDFQSISIRKNYYRAILDGYLEVMNQFLTDAEKKHIHYAGLLMIYMQALRFLTDYLLDDPYYRIDYPGQNFDRAKNQFTLLQRLEEHLAEEFRFRV